MSIYYYLFRRLPPPVSDFGSVEIVSLKREGNIIVVRMKHLGGEPVKGTVTVDTDYKLRTGVQLATVEPVSFYLDKMREDDIRVKMNGQMDKETMFKVTATSDNLRFKKIMYRGYL